MTKLIKAKSYEEDQEINQTFKEGMLMKWYHLLLIAAACVLSFLCGMRVRKTPVTNTEIKKVVEYRYDTITREKPIYITKYVKSFMLIPAKDTVNIHDTTFVYVPREYKVYQDSSYRAVVSGYDPRLDSIEIYYPTKIVTITIAGGASYTFSGFFTNVAQDLYLNSRLWVSLGSGTYQESVRPMMQQPGPEIE